MSLRRRLRVLYAALTQRWHAHHCDCGVVWYCCAPKWCDLAQPYRDQCLSCEGEAAERWMVEQVETARWRQKGLAG